MAKKKKPSATSLFSFQGGTLRKRTVFIFRKHITNLKFSFYQISRQHPEVAFACNTAQNWQFEK
jgi:hypothetical protein